MSKGLHPTFICLLRGINVGGKNIIKMEALKKSFEALGFSNVQSYIQSGNIIFSAGKKSVKTLTAQIEQKLSSDFNYSATAVVLDANDLNEVIAGAPKGFGKEPDKYSYDVLFFFHGHSPKEYFESIEIKEGVDDKYCGKKVIYFRRFISKATSSKLSKIISSPLYQVITIRNWNTTMKLSKLIG